VQQVGALDMDAVRAELANSKAEADAETGAKAEQAAS
jgi:hypothetical protein